MKGKHHNPAKGGEKSHERSRMAHGPYAGNGSASMRNEKLESEMLKRSQNSTPLQKDGNHKGY